jgi:hypothetical protein
VSGFRQSWHKWRWIVFLIGMAFRGHHHSVVRYCVLHTPALRLI